jgi:hypothetical protein
MKYTITFDVISEADAKRVGCYSNIYVSTTPRVKGEVFVHHFYKVECVATSCVGFEPKKLYGESYPFA